MKAISLHDKKQIEAVLRQNTPLNLYALGDLDDFFWPYTSWYGWPSSSEIEQVVLMYTGEPLPVLLAMTDGKEEALAQLLSDLLPVLPARFYAHLNGPAESVLDGAYQKTSHGMHYKMSLRDWEAVQKVDTSGAVQLRPADLPALEALYAASYPGNWFQPRMLETGFYFGCWEGDRLVSVAGVHVYSRQFHAAALGNITTHPEFRGRGLGRRVTARLCQALRDTAGEIGLNVKIDNLPAITCYRRLGFETVATYEECTLEIRLPARSG